MDVRFTIPILLIFFVGCGAAQTPLDSEVSKVATSAEQPASVIHVSYAMRGGPPSQKAKITHLAEGQNAYVGKLWLAPGGKVPLHRDPTEEYLYVVSGGGELTMDGKTYTLKTGHAVYMPAGAEVTFQNGPEPLVVIQVFAGPDSAKKYGKWGAVKEAAPSPSATEATPASP